MVAGRRFDLEAARAEARAAKRAARIRSIVSNAVLVLMLLGLCGGALYGWNWWQERQAAKAAEEQVAREAEERAAAERQRKEAERRAAEAAARAAEAERRAAEQAAREAEREAKRKALEEARARERQAREEAARQAKENEAWQRANKGHVDKTVSTLNFSVFDHIFTEYGADAYLDIAVDERRWVELAACAASGQSIEFLDMLRSADITNDFSVTHYPDRATLKQLLNNLAKERFTMVVRFKQVPTGGRRLTLVAADPQGGLVMPQGARTIKDSNGRLAGWTAPFVYGSNLPLFVMGTESVDRFNREWRALASRIRRDAAKLDNAESFVAARLEKEIVDFVRSVKVEISMVPQVEQKQPERREPKIKSMGGLKGSNMDIRKMSGPRSRR